MISDMADHLLQETRLEITEQSVHSTFLQAAKPRADGLTAVILHGAGQSDSSRHALLASFFADAGISVVSLDFVGHGKTGGDMKASSLALRTRHAAQAIDHWAPDKPLILCGFSMSGHTVLRLAAQLANRVQSIGLFCPATYAAKAEDLAFGPSFTETIRQPESWRTSLALRDAAHFTGKAAVVIGAKDNVIPWDVVVATVTALKTGAKETRLEILSDADHRLALWLGEHQSFGQDIVRYLSTN